MWVKCSFLSGISIDTTSFLILVNQEIEAWITVKDDIKQPLELKSGYKSSKLSEGWI